jgi:hypothetical protein
VAVVTCTEAGPAVGWTGYEDRPDALMASASMLVEGVIAMHAGDDPNERIRDIWANQETELVVTSTSRPVLRLVDKLAN